jgi:hypothetical protein
LVIFGAFSCAFRGEDLEFLCGICSGNHTWGRGASFLGDFAPSNPWKGLRFGGFRWSSRRGVLVVELRFLLIWWVLGHEHLAKGCPWGTPAIPKVSLESVERIRRPIEVKFEFFPQVEFFSTAQAKPA